MGTWGTEKECQIFHSASRREKGNSYLPNINRENARKILIVLNYIYN